MKLKERSLMIALGIGTGGFWLAALWFAPRIVAVVGAIAIIVGCVISLWPAKKARNLEPCDPWT